MKKIYYALIGIVLIGSVTALYVSGFDFIGYLTATSGQSNIECSKTFTITNRTVIESCQYTVEELISFNFSIDTSGIVSSDLNCTIEEDRDYRFFIGIDNKSFENLITNPKKIIPSGDHMIDVMVEPHTRRCPVDNLTFTVTGIPVEILNETETLMLFECSGEECGCGPANCNNELCMGKCNTTYPVCFSVNARCENYQPGQYWRCWCDTVIPF